MTLLTLFYEFFISLSLVHSYRLKGLYALLLYLDFLILTLITTVILILEHILSLVPVTFAVDTGQSGMIFVALSAFFLYYLIGELQLNIMATAFLVNINCL